MAMTVPGIETNRYNSSENALQDYPGKHPSRLVHTTSGSNHHDPTEGTERLASSRDCLAIGSRSNHHDPTEGTERCRNCRSAPVIDDGSNHHDPTEGTERLS